LRYTNGVSNDQPSDGYEASADPAPLTMRLIFQTWWPLAASWLLMGLEGPAISAIVARLANPEINLAAWGGIVYPLSLVIEAPIIMLLSASTALSTDYDAYRKVYRFMMAAGAALTLLHLLIAFTPLYDLMVMHIIGAPAEIVEPGRIGLMVMLPWTWSIAYRRSQQGVLIRFGHSQAVGVGTVVRLAADGVVLILGYLIGRLPGIVVAAGAASAGVLAEAVYAGLRVRPVVRDEVRRAAPSRQPLTLRAFLAFYIPLALTPLLNLLQQPIGSMALSRMPLSVPSLAVWSVITGLIFLPRSLGLAFNEVVVALLDRPGAVRRLRRFAGLLFAGTSGFLLLIAATPLSPFWFGRLSALSPELTALAVTGLWLALPAPGLTTLQSWYQGSILYGRRTRGITESVALALLTSSVVLLLGVVLNRIVGLYVGLFAFFASGLAQTGWLWFRSRPIMRRLDQRGESPFDPARGGLQELGDERAGKGKEDPR